MMEFNLASDVQKKMEVISQKLNFPHFAGGKAKKIICFRSYGSKSRAYARIWAFPRIWQKALNLKPHYCLEVLSEKFDKLNKDEQTKVIIHELLHIPKNFSGALLPHHGRGRINIDRKTVNKLFKKIK